MIWIYELRRARRNIQTEGRIRRPAHSAPCVRFALMAIYPISAVAIFANTLALPTPRERCALLPKYAVRRRQNAQPSYGAAPPLRRSANPEILPTRCQQYSVEEKACRFAVRRRGPPRKLVALIELRHGSPLRPLPRYTHTQETPSPCQRLIAPTNSILRLCIVYFTKSPVYLPSFAP